MRIRIYCPVCECAGTLPTGSSSTWTCPRCEHVVELTSGADDTCCAACANPEMYRKKDFPHALGMGILLSALAASTITYWLYDKVLTWVILLGSFGFDLLLYLWVKDVVVCYRCGAEHRAMSAPERFAPFELTIGERYRQERMRAVK